MQASTNEDSHFSLLYINGVPHAFPAASAQQLGQLQQQRQLPYPPPQQQLINDALAAAAGGSAPHFVVAPIVHPGQPFLSPHLTCLPAPQQPQEQQQHQQAPSVKAAPLHMLVLQSPPGTPAITASGGATWLQVLTSPMSPTLTGNVSNLSAPAPPAYHAMVPLSTASLSPGSAGVPTSPLTVPPPPSHALVETHLSQPQQQALQSASAAVVDRCCAKQHLRNRSLHQRGTARLFVGQIHYDATEDDLFQIFGVYGKVLDVKIMRSGESDNNNNNSNAAPLTNTPDGAGAFSSKPNNNNSTATFLSHGGLGGNSATITGTADVSPNSLNTASRTCTKSVGGTNTSRTHVHVPPAPLTSSKPNRRCNAFVTYASMVEADAAISALHGRYVMGRDRPLQVTYCQATENISQYGFAHAVQLHNENKINPLPFKLGAPTHR